MIHSVHNKVVKLLAMRIKDQREAQKQTGMPAEYCYAMSAWFT